jgi:hypothetical protein
VKRLPIALLAAAALSLTACTGLQGGSEPHDDDSAESTAASDDEFCEAMSHLIVLLDPTDSSSPSETRTTFEAAAIWFEQAGDAAPQSIASDVLNYVDAFAEYTQYLDDVDYRLDVVFSTQEGTDRAIDTSHTLTPAIVGYVTDECELSFGDTS